MFFRQPVHKPVVLAGTGTNTVTVTVPAVIGKANYLLKLLGKTDLSTATLTIASNTSTTVVMGVSANGLVNVDLYGFYKSAVNTAVTVTLTGTSSVNLSVIYEAISLS